MRTEEGNLTCSTTRKESEKLDRENTKPSEANAFLMCWKMRWTTTSEQHCSLQVVGSFLEKHGRIKSTAQAHVASTAALLHPQCKNLPRRTTQRQQRQFKKKKKRKKQPFSSLSNTKLNGPQSRSILGGHPNAVSVPGYYGRHVTRKESIELFHVHLLASTFSLCASAHRWPMPSCSSLIWPTHISSTPHFLDSDELCACKLASKSNGQVATPLGVSCEYFIPCGVRCSKRVLNALSETR